MDIKSEEDFDGKSLLSLIRREKFPELIAYSEELFKNRGPGSLQSVRIPKYKLIKNTTKNIEEFYDMQKDPEEKTNIIETSDSKEKVVIQQSREIMNKMQGEYESRVTFTEEEKTEKEKGMINNLVKKMREKS